MENVASPDEELVTAARGGDRAAFGRLVESHAARVFRVCHRVTGDDALAEDAVQETFIKVHEKLRDFRGQAQFSTWLHRIAVNAALELMRRNRKYREDPVDEPAAMNWQDDAPSLERQTESAGIGRRLHAAMQRLSELERTAFSLRHFEEMSIAEICELAGVKESACKQAIFRAVQKMRDALGDYEVNHADSQ